MRRALLATSLAFGALGALGALGAGCWAGQDVDHSGDPIVARASAVVVEGCALDDAQTTTVSQDSTRKVLGEIILLCAAIQPDATVAPLAADDRTALTAQVAALHALGYRVTIATTIGPSWDAPSSPADATTTLEALDPSTLAPNVLTLAQSAGFDGVDLALPQLEVDAKIAGSLDALVQALSGALHPSTKLYLFAPPSTQDPSDVEGADAYDLAILSRQVDRVRVMTLDYSCCGAPLGPTTDPGWAVDAARFASDTSPPSQVDIAYPLYGWDTSIATGTATTVTFAQAESLATTTNATIARGPTGAPYFDYTGGDGTRHEVWFDDATSTLRALHAWDASTLPPSVGVVYYGLGAEDPKLWDAIAQVSP